MAGVVESINDMASLLGDELHCRVVLERKVVDTGVHAEADDGATHGGVGDGTAVAVFVAVEKDVSGEVAYGGGLLLLAHFLEEAVEVGEDVHGFCFGGGFCFCVGGVGCEDIVEETSG